MSTLIVVQARMGSTRLPGKVLADVYGTPLLGFLLRRLVAAGVGAVTVATTNASRDDAVVAAAEAEGVPTVRGPEDDVLTRFVMALDATPSETVVRITADCPLTDPAVIVRALALHGATAADYTTNTLVRTFPDGLDVEVMSGRVLRELDRLAPAGAEREHVTTYLHRHTPDYRVAALTTPRRLGHLRWTVDTLDDLEHVRRLVARSGHPLTDPWTEFLDDSEIDAGRRPGPVLLVPLLAGDGSAVGTDGRWRPLGGGPTATVDPDSWWGRSLTTGSTWMNSPGTPFFVAWSARAADRPDRPDRPDRTVGWVGLEMGDDDWVLWGSGEERWHAGIRDAVEIHLEGDLRHARPPASGPVRSETLREA